jgi:hypothetical protein
MGIFQAIKRVVTGEVIKKLDILTNGGMTTVSLRLKQDRKEGERYVVLAFLSSGNYQYCSLNAGEFREFVEAASELQNDLEKPKAV